jgi:hypothetical protein
MIQSLHCHALALKFKSFFTGDTLFLEMKRKNLSFNRGLALQTKLCFVFAHISSLNMTTSMSPHDCKIIYDSKGQNK